MRFRVLIANDSRPGCDFLCGNRSSGFSLLVLGMSIGFILPFKATAQRISQPESARLFVGSVVSESFVLKDVTKPFPERSVVVTPAGSAMVHLSKPTEPAGVVTVSALFLQTGRVTIRLPAGVVRSDRDGNRTPVRIYDVRPWPRAMSVEPKGNVIRAGAGDLSATLDANEGNSEAGSPIRIDLKLTGPAALAVENVPELRIRSSKDSVEPDTRFRPMLVDSTVDWGVGAGETPRRTWSFEWRAMSPGAFRVEPLRVVHLDAKGQIQTRLVSGPGFRIRPRALFRVVESGGNLRRDDELDQNSFAIRNKDAIKGLVASCLFCLAVAGLLRGLAKSRWFLKWRIERVLRQATTQRQALASWRAFALERPRIRNGVDCELRKADEELTRRAFGRETQ